MVGQAIRVAQTSYSSRIIPCLPHRTTRVDRPERPASGSPTTARFFAILAAGGAETRPAGPPAPAAGGPMKLITAIVQDEDLPTLLDGLTRTDFRATSIGSTGGFLRSGNSTVLVGVEDHQVGRVISIIRERCRTRTQLMNPYSPALEPGLLYMPPQIEVEVGGAVIFVQNIVRFERL